MTVKELRPSDNSEVGVIENVLFSSAVVVPRDSFPLNNSTLLPASAVPSITRFTLLVSDVVVVIVGFAGAAVSTFIVKASDAAEILPAASVALTIKELRPSDNAEVGVIENSLFSSAVVVPNFVPSSLKAQPYFVPLFIFRFNIS